MSKNILLTRIDNRLIHGQIVGEWASTISANLLVVVDDDAYNNELDKMVMKTAASTLGYDSRFFSLQQAIDTLHKASSNQKILLICKEPSTVKRLIEGGVDIDKVNIGNMHFDPGEINLGQKVYANEDEVKDLDFIKSKVKEIYIQDLPSMKKEKY